MLRYFVVLVLPNLCYGLFRIVGGMDALITGYPYQAAFIKAPEGILVCGGAIVSSRTILTAAHCYKPYLSTRPLEEVYQIKVGSSYRSGGGSFVSVERVVIHPDYFQDYIYNDIAVVIVGGSLAFSDAVQPIGLAGGSVREGMVGTVTGWGRSDPGMSAQPEVLQAVDLPVWSLEKCREMLGQNGQDGRQLRHAFCAGLEEGGKDSCHGDSGGPFASQKLLYGIVSFGFNCAQPHKAGVYTDISFFVPFITTNGVF